MALTNDDVDSTELKSISAVASMNDVQISELKNTSAVVVTFLVEKVLSASNRDSWKNALMATLKAIVDGFTWTFNQSVQDLLKDSKSFGLAKKLDDLQDRVSSLVHLNVELENFLTDKLHLLKGLPQDQFGKLKHEEVPLLSDYEFLFDAKKEVIYCLDLTIAPCVCNAEYDDEGFITELISFIERSHDETINLHNTLLKTFAALENRRDTQVADSEESTIVLLANAETFYHSFVTIFTSSIEDLLSDVENFKLLDATAVFKELDHCQERVWFLIALSNELESFFDEKLLFLKKMEKYSENDVLVEHEKVADLCSVLLIALSNKLESFFDEKLLFLKKMEKYSEDDVLVEHEKVADLSQYAFLSEAMKDLISCFDRTVNSLVENGEEGALTDLINLIEISHGGITDLHLTLLMIGFNLSGSAENVVSDEDPVDTKDFLKTIYNFGVLEDPCED